MHLPDLTSRALTISGARPTLSVTDSARFEQRLAVDRWRGRGWTPWVVGASQENPISRPLRTGRSYSAPVVSVTNRCLKYFQVGRPNLAKFYFFFSFTAIMKSVQHLKFVKKPKSVKICSISNLFNFKSVPNLKICSISNLFNFNIWKSVLFRICSISNMFKIRICSILKSFHNSNLFNLKSIRNSNLFTLKSVSKSNLFILKSVPKSFFFLNNQFEHSNFGTEFKVIFLKKIFKFEKLKF
jgi:hypothetical protein